MFKELLTLFIAVVGTWLLLALQGWVLSVMWGWYIAPLGVVMINWAHGAGIVCVVSLFMCIEYDQIIHEQNLHSLGMWVAAPFVVLLFGYLFKGFV